MPTPTYTNQELLDLWRAAAASLAQNKAYTINGRSLTRADSAEVVRMIGYFQNLVNAENGDTGIVLAATGIY